MAGNNLINSEVEVTEEECKQLCQDTHECEAYTYFYEDNFPYHDLCNIFSSCETLVGCQHCLTEYVTSYCTCGVEYEGSVDSDNLIEFLEDVLTEGECQQHCSAHSSCSVYTYYDRDHKTDRLLCTLLSGLKNPVQQCEHCKSGGTECEAFGECIVGVLDTGPDMSLTDLVFLGSTTLVYK